PNVSSISRCYLFFLRFPLPPISPLFPYTTLFRSPEALARCLIGLSSDSGMPPYSRLLLEASKSDARPEGRLSVGRTRLGERVRPATFCALRAQDGTRILRSDALLPPML